METRRKLRKTINSLDQTLRVLAERVAELEYPCATTKGRISMSLALVDSVGEQVLGGYLPPFDGIPTRERITESVSVQRVLRAIEEYAGITISYSQNDRKVVIFEREET